MTSYNQEFCSRLITDGFTYFFWQHESIGGTLNFRVSAYSRDRLIGEEIRYILFVKQSVNKKVSTGTRAFLKSFQQFRYRNDFCCCISSSPNTFFKGFMSYLS